MVHRPPGDSCKDRPCLGNHCWPGRHSHNCEDSAVGDAEQGEPDSLRSRFQDYYIHEMIQAHSRTSVQPPRTDQLQRGHAAYTQLASALNRCRITHSPPIPAPSSRAGGAPESVWLTERRASWDSEWGTDHLQIPQASLANTAGQTGLVANNTL